MEIFDYDNILLLPRKCRVESRSECDASIEFGGRRFALPVVPSNMKTVLDESVAQYLARSGHFYVMHRFDLDNVAFARRMREQGLLVSISSGVKPPTSRSSTAWPSKAWAPTTSPSTSRTATPTACARPSSTSRPSCPRPS
jgi:IMP dehydrogenase/GMP reductase